VGSAFEQVSRERMPQEVRMDALRVEPGALREPPQDQERAGPRQRAAARVQEELGAVPPVEIRPPTREIPAQRLHRGAADRHDALLAALADRSDEPPVEVDARRAEPDRL